MAWSQIIGDGVNPFWINWFQKLEVRNNSTEAVQISNICAYVSSWISLIWWIQCTGHVWILYPGSSYIWTSYPVYAWNIAPITWSFDDNIVKVTACIDNNLDWVCTSNELKKWAYFEWSLLVRVSRPSVVTKWWWISYLKPNSKIANVNSVALQNKSKNKNFVWLWASTWNMSSYTTNITNSTKVNNVSKAWKNFTWSINNLPVNGITNTFTRYNWLNNVYIKSWNYTFTPALYSLINWPTTFIIENGNLNINSNITYSNYNIAFVVRWWNINIDKSVTIINWTYISIAKNWIWGMFMANWWKTINVLNVIWSLYWNISNLVANRTYINQNVSGIINVWTIVSFASNLFRRPAPMLSVFIKEYLAATRVAK